MPAPAPHPTSTTSPPKKRRKSRLRRWLVTGLVVLVGIFVLVYFLTPTLVSSSWMRGKATTSARDKIDGEVTIPGLRFSWSKGVVIEGLEVANPPGFPPGPALSIDRVEAGLSWKSLLMGKIAVQAQVRAPRLHVHVREDGKINLAELQRAERENDRASKEPGSGDQEANNERGRDFDLKLRCEVSDGLVEIVDAARGIEERIQAINVTIANQDFGAAVALALDAELAGRDAGKKGGITLRAQVDPRREEALDFAAFETSGFDIADYAPLAAAFMKEAPFETLRGKLRGKLAVKAVDASVGADVGANAETGSGSGYALVGDMLVEGLDVRGGPFGPGRGLVGEQWTLRPNLRFDPRKLSASFEGSDLDFGFATVRPASPTAADALLHQDNVAAGAVGLVVDVDLQKLGQQPLLPKGEYRGSLRIEVALVPTAASAAQALPWGLVVETRDVDVRGVLGAGPLVATEAMRFESHGDVQLATAGDDPGLPSALRGSGAFTLRGQGVDTKGRFALLETQDFEASLSGDLVTEQLSSMVAAFLPKGLALVGKGRLEAAVRGRLEGDARSGGLLASSPLRGEASFSIDALNWLGSSLRGLRSDIVFDGKNLDVKTADGAQLNAGPLSLTLQAKDLLGDASTLDFRLSWSGGQANAAMVPALQYVVPLLAGLPTQSLESLAGISFDASAGLTLEGSGPLPKSGADVLAALDQWSAKGALKLANGSFTPSPLLKDLFRFFGDQGRVTFRDISSAIRIEGGKVFTEGFELGGKDGILRLAGSATLGGKLDVRIDLSDILAKHKDGQKILAVLGGKLTTELAGTIWQPRLDLGATLDQALQTAVKQRVEGAAKDAAKDALDKLLQGKKPDLEGLLDKLKGKK